MRTAGLAGAGRCLSLLCCLAAGAGCGPDREAGARTLAALPPAGSEPQVEFGLDPAADAEVLGGVADLAVDRDGFVYLLDPVERRLVVFEPGGRLLDATEDAGDPDPPLEHPVSVDLLGDEVVVFDEGRRSLVFFRRGESELQHAGEAPLELFARRMCVLDGQIFLLGYHEGRLIHEVDREGVILRSFGEPFFAEPEILARGITSGLLTCVGGEDPLLLLAEERFARVRGYDAAGGVLRWSHEPEDFRAVEVAATPDGTGIVFSDPSDGPPHRWVSLHALGPHVVVQRGIVEDAIGAALQITEVETRVLDSATGETLAVGEDRIRVDALVHDRWAFQRALVPRPSVRRFGLRTTAVEGS